MIIITDKARSEIKRIIIEQDKENIFLRLRVVGGGCSGFQTKLDLDEVFDEKFDTIEENGDLKVVIDKRSVMYLENLEIDFHEDLNQRGFVLKNPAATGVCGCGRSNSF